MAGRIMARANIRAWGHSLRRVTALVLALAMLLPVAAMAAGAQEMPVKVTEDSERPTVTLELNAVAGSTGAAAADALTGELELALRVKTGTITPTVGDPVDQPFSSISLALEISPLLTPAGFDDAAVDVTATNGLAAMTGMETLKVEKKLSTAGAMVAAKRDPEYSDNILGYYLILTAEAHRPLVLDQEGGNTLLVVNFTYDLTGSDFKADGGTPLLASEASAVAKWLAGVGNTVNSNENALVKFVSARLLDENPAAAPRELTYQSAANTQRPYGNTLYYTDVTYTTVGETGTDDAGKDVPVLGVQAADASDLADATKYTVTTNAIPLSTNYTAVEAGQINFSLVNGLSNDPEKRDAIIIEFFDWDDTQIGALSVAPGVDAREAVNTYVKTHFIHPDLQSNTNYSSLTRADTYRGKYPSTPSAPDAVDATMDSQRSDYVGSDYPLTNKLDYVFLKKNMAEDSGKWAEGALSDEEKDGGGMDLYPYIRGWAVTSLSKVFDSENTDWTTLGVGELSGYGAAAGITPAQIQFADFDFENNSLEAGSVYAVKAVYEPGASIRYTNYTIIDQAKLRKLTYSTSTDVSGTTFSVEFHYGRVATIDGVLYGIGRARDPAVRVEMVPDVSSLGESIGALSSIYQQVLVDNVDEPRVFITPASNVADIDYTLIDRYTLNYMIGATYSTYGDDRSMIVPGNFNHKEFPYSQRLGTMGLVYEATVQTLLEEGLKQVDNLPNHFNDHWGLTLNTIDDLNLKKDAKGTNFFDFEVYTARDYFIDMIRTARSAGWSDDKIMNLSWHQIQYYFIHRNNDFLDETKVDAETYPTWCRMNDGCVDPEIIVVSDLETLLQAAKKQVDDPSHTASLNTLMTMDIVNQAPTYLRADENGTPFANEDISTFKTNVIAIVSAYGTNLSWEQVQYALLHSNTLPSSDPEDAAVKAAFNHDYWWYNGGQKVTDWDGLIAATKQWIADGRDAVLRTANGDDLLTITHNLASAAVGNDNGYSSYTAFTTTTFDDLCNALRTAVENLSAVIQSPSWDQVQYQIIKNSVAAADTMTKYGLEHFWWYDQGSLVVDLESLLAADRIKQASSRSAAMNQLTAVPLYFKKNFAGEDFDSVDAFRAAVDKVSEAQDGTNKVTDWEGVQYYLLHASTYSYSEYTKEKAYYWWKGGNAGYAWTFSGTLETLLRAAFAKRINKNTAAWTNLTAVYVSFPRLRKVTEADAASETYAATHADYNSLPTYEDADLPTLEKDMEDLVEAAVTAQLSADSNYHGHTPPTLTWAQVQKYLSGGGFEPDTTKIDTKNTYWWGGTGNPENPNKKEDDNNSHDNFNQIMEYLEAYRSGTSVADSINKVTIDMMNASDVKLRKNTNGDEWTAADLTTLQTKLKKIVDKGNTSTPVASKVTKKMLANATWWQIQNAVALSSGAVKDPTATNKTKFEAWAPTWVKAGDGSYTTSSLDLFSTMSLMSLSPMKAALDEEEETEHDALADADPAQLASALLDKLGGETLVIEVDGVRYEYVKGQLLPVEAEAAPADPDPATEEEVAAEPVDPVDPDPAESAEVVEEEPPADPDPAESAEVVEEEPPADPDPAESAEVVEEEPAAAPETAGEQVDAITGADPASAPPEEDPPEADPPSDTGQTTNITDDIETVEGGDDEVTTGDNTVTIVYTKRMTPPIVAPLLADSGGGRIPLLLSRSFGKVVTVV